MLVPKIILDTSTLVAGILSPRDNSPSRLLLQAWRAARVCVVVTEDIELEYRSHLLANERIGGATWAQKVLDVLAAHDVRTERVAYEGAAAGSGRIVPFLASRARSPDTGDQMFLDLAASLGDEIAAVIAEDRGHLLSLDQVAERPVLPARVFVMRYVR
ncbi:MAG: PIN domain-containing protein [Myxococcota bacterium]|nr:PIN domain-containing protein [Myxococcota bacterium]